MLYYSTTLLICNSSRERVFIFVARFVTSSVTRSEVFRRLDLRCGYFAIRATTSLVSIIDATVDSSNQLPDEVRRDAPFLGSSMLNVEAPPRLKVRSSKIWLK